MELVDIRELVVSELGPGGSASANVRPGPFEAPVLLVRLARPRRDRDLPIAVVEAKADQLKTLRAKTTAELDAPLPSILDKAFQREL